MAKKTFVGRGVPSGSDTTYYIMPNRMSPGLPLAQREALGDALDRALSQSNTFSYTVVDAEGGVQICLHAAPHEVHLTLLRRALELLAARRFHNPAHGLDSRVPGLI